MSDTTQEALNLLAAEYSKIGNTFRAEDIRNGRVNADEHLAVNAIRAALLTAPPGWKLVPIPPTEEMIDAASDAHMPFGDMHFAITSAILAAPEPK